jgi:hypothetical protein
MVLDKRYLPLVAAAITLIATTVRAEEINPDEIRRGITLICDTVEQVEAYIKAEDDGVANPMTTVNATEMVCGLGAVAYVRGRKLKEIATKHGTLDVVEILVVGISSDPVTPYKQITVFRAKSENP